MRTLRSCLTMCVLAAAGASGCGSGRAALRLSSDGIGRRELHVRSDPGVEIFVREVRTADENVRGVPVLLVHGARAPGVASFDLEVPGGSLAAELAQAGHRVLVMDARGYGGSTRPHEMELPPERHEPLVRSDEVVRDIAAVVERIRSETGAKRVAVLGWATGGLWAGMYAALEPDKVSHLILLNSLYGGSPTHPSFGRGSDLEDPQHPGRFNAAAFGAYRFNTAESAIAPWSRNIPVADKSVWRDPVVAEAYGRAALASDPTSGQRTPPSFRSPNGAMEDSFYLATGRQFWDASLVHAATLVVRSDLDFWSRPEDVQLLVAHLVHARRVEVLRIPGATHCVHLDRDEHGRRQLIQAVTSFLGT